MIINATNITAIDIILTDLGKFKLPPNVTVDLAQEFVGELYLFASCEDLITGIAAGDILINNGEEDLSVSDALQYVVMQNVYTGPKDDSGKMRVHQTSRPYGTVRCWSGVVDNSADVHAVWGGNTTNIRHQVSDTSPIVKYLDINCVKNRTWLHEGLVMWEGCKLDTISLEVVPRVVNVEAGTNTNYNLVDGYLVVPAAGDGTITLLSDITVPNNGLVRMTPDDDGISPQAFWDATYNQATKQYENITPNVNGTGEYNVFSQEVVLNAFVKDIPLLGSGFLPFKSSDKREFGHGMRIKLTGTTNTTDWADHDWVMAFILCTHREHSS